MSDKGRRRSISSPVSVIGGDDFFKKEEPLPDDYLPVTGDPSLYHMPWLGRVGDSKNEPPPPSVKTKIADRKTYIKMSPGTIATEDSSVEQETVCESCGTGLRPRCGCCAHLSGHRGAGGRKGSGARKQTKRARKIEAMTMAAFQAEKMGRRLAMAASMFAAGFAMGTMASKWESEDEEEESSDQ